MRRLILVTLSAALVLAACSDRESPTEPSVPAPEETFGSTCPVVRFPLLTTSNQIAEVFPKGRLRLEALARVGAIKLFWDTCHEAGARRAAVGFIDWMNLKFTSGDLPGATAAEVQTLTIIILTGVGVPLSTPATENGDIGVGLYDPATTTNTIIKTASSVALTELQPGAFESSPDEVRLIVVERKPDNPPGIVFDGQTFPPYFDYDAIKLTGTTTAADKVLKTDKKAVIAFCLLPAVEYPDGARIGHNPVQGAPDFPFELLDELSLRDEAGELTDLGRELDCGNLQPDGTVPGVIGSLGRRLPAFAQGIWGAASNVLDQTARALFLPQTLQAVTVGFLGPIGGKTTSLSPFGVVEGGYECVGNVTGTFDNIVVPPDAFCTLSNSTVNGDIRALDRSRLFMINMSIAGDIEGNRAENVQLVAINDARNLVGGSIRIRDGGEGAFICGTDLSNGSIEVERMTGFGDQNGFVHIGGSICEGGYGGGNTLPNGDIRVHDNTHPENGIGLQITGNSVGGDLRVTNSQGPGEKLVQNNLVGGTLACSENEAPFLGGPNVAGAAEGQCF